MGGMAAGEVADKRTFFSESQTLGTSGTHKINKGVIEWPFEFELHGDMSESIEGMSSTWVVYNLIATVSRPGWNAKDLCRAVHVRIVRTLGAEQMEGTRSRVSHTRATRTQGQQKQRLTTVSRPIRISGQTRSAIVYRFQRTP